MPCCASRKPTRWSALLPVGVVAACAFSVAGEAHAADVDFNGFYQARMRMFDTLSLRRDIEANEGLSWYTQHRLNLRPRIWVSEEVSLHAELRALENQLWGSPAIMDAGAPGAPPFPDTFSTTPGILMDGTPQASISMARAWGEVRTKAGTFKFGRQPLHWGMGIWWNDGLGENQEFGDTADRVSWEKVFAGNVWVRAGADVNMERLVNRNDDTTTLHVAGAYRSETLDAGILLAYRRRGAQSGARFDMFVVDAAFDLQFGIIGIDGEVNGQFGNGDLLDGRNDVRILNVGAVLDLSLALPKVKLHVMGGLATGDQDPNDARLRTFTFNRDFNIGLFLGEQPMPLLSSDVPGQDRSTNQVIVGNAVSNMLFLRPSVSYEAVRGLEIEGAFVTGRTARVPESEQDPDRRSYGYEIDLGVRYTGVRFFTLSAMGAVFIPGNRFTNFSDDIYDGFNAPAFGGQILGRIEF